MNVINDQLKMIANSFVVPDEALDLVPGPLRYRARATQETAIPKGIVR